MSIARFLKFPIMNQRDLNASFKIGIAWLSLALQRPKKQAVITHSKNNLVKKCITRRY